MQQSSYERTDPTNLMIAYRKFYNLPKIFEILSHGADFVLKYS
jgi:hypothetical protein